MSLDLNFYIILPVAIVLFCLSQGYLGKTLQNIVKFISSPTILEYFVFLLLLCLVLYLCSDIAYAMSPEGSDIPKPVVKVSDNTVNVHNPNINLPAEILGMGLTNVGVGAAIAGGMNAMAVLVKSSPLPPAIKVGTVIAGGVAAGTLITATNAANSITQKKINYNTPTVDTNTSATYPTTTGSGTTGAIPSITTSNVTNTASSTTTGTFGSDGPHSFSIESIENISQDNSIMNLLNSNYYLHIIILYLLFNLTILLLFDLINKYN